MARRHFVPVRNWEDRRLTRNVVCCNIYVIYCHSGILHLCVTSIFNFKICLMLEAGTPAASFIKFTTNLLSAAIKDAVFVEGNGHSSDKVPRGKRKAHSSARPVRPTQNRPARRPSPPLSRRPQPRSPDGACSPISRSVSRPRFRSGRGRERERHRPV